MGLGLKFREKLPDDVVGEFDNLFAAVRGFFFSEHNEDGTHSAVVADSVELQGATVGTLTDVAYDASRFFASGASVWTVSSDDQVYFKYSRIGQLVHVAFAFQTMAITVDTSASLYMRLPELHAMAIRASATGSPAYFIGGVLNWNDITNGTSGMGMVSAQAQAFSGSVPSTIIQLDRCKDGTSAASMFSAWAISANFNFSGSCWFMCEPNNIAVPFYGS